MNHAKAANVVWKKQRLGPKPAMHFYTCAKVLPGDELCFDCACWALEPVTPFAIAFLAHTTHVKTLAITDGDEYWDALGVTPP